MFIGLIGVGKWIMCEGVEMMKCVFFEFGGKFVNIVFDDVLEFV